MADDVFGIVGGVIAGQYHVENVVAEGGFGVLYRAHPGSSRTPVALKLLKVSGRDPQQQAAFLQLFRVEGELLRRLSARLPNLVRALHVDAFTSSDGRFVPYLVLEWLEGMTLETLIEQRQRANLAPVPLRKLVRLLTPVARALEQAHHFSGPHGPLSIVHGDLTPKRLFAAQVAGEEVVKILDFGLSKLKSAASQIAGGVSHDGGTLLAFTPAYAAPEQWAPRQYGPIGPWTDVWGLALCMSRVMAARPVIEGAPAEMMGVALDPKRRPTPRTEGVDLPQAIEAVFERALSLEPRARQRHVGIFWNELVAALDQPELIANARAPEIAEDLEFDPTSVRGPTAAPVRAAAVSGAHFVPDLEIAPPSLARRPSGERPLVQPAPADANLETDANALELDSASMLAAQPLDLDLPADEPRAQRSVSSQHLAQVRSSNPPPTRLASSGLSGSMAAVREPLPGSPTSGVIATRSSSAEPNGLVERAGDPLRSLRNSRPPPSADVSAAFETGFVAKIELKLAEERSLLQRLRAAFALLGAAVVVAIFDPIYAAATGEVLQILGQRLSLLAGALLVLAVALAAREVTRER